MAAKQNAIMADDASKRELTSYLLQEIQDCKRFDEARAQDRIYADQLLRGERLGTVPQGDPQVVSTDASDAVESILPDLLEIFNGGDDPVSIKGQTVRAREAAKNQRELIKYQLNHQLPWFRIQYTFIKDALAYRNCYVQWGWDFRYRWEENEYERLTLADLKKILWDGGEVLKKGKPRPWVWNGRPVGWLEISVRERVIVKNQPLIKCLPPGAVLISPGAVEIEDAPFVAVRDYPTMYRLKQEGQALGYDLAGVKPGPLTSDDETAARAAERGREDPLAAGSDDPERGRVERMVCYIQWDLAGKGELEPAIATLVDDRLVHVGPNVFGRPPIEYGSPMLDTHNHEGRSLVDMVKEFQHIKTALYRSVLKVIRLNTTPQWLAERDSGVDLNSLLRSQSGVTMVNPGKLSSIKALERQGLGAEVRWFAEWLESLKEQRVGVTRLNQGLEGKGLTDTARGMLSLMAKADKRIRLIARLLAEMLYKPIFRALIWLNQNLIDRELVVALTDDADDDTVFTPEDLGGEFDLVVNVGLGNSDRNMIVSQGQQMLQITTALAKLPNGAAMVTPENVYQLVKTIYEAMGWQPQLYISDPNKQQEASLGGLPGQGQGAPGGVAHPGGARPARGGIPRLARRQGVPGALPPGAPAGLAGGLQTALDAEQG